VLYTKTVALPTKS